jgi:hypothetical protein
MPSQFSTIGFTITSGEDLATLASGVADKADRVATPPGDYLKWAPPSGEQLWLQISPAGDAMGMSAHFGGKASMRVAIEARVARPSHTPLDGTFLAWANPPEGAATGGDYPFAFDCPDAATHLELPLPATVTVQLAAFAQQVTLHDSPAAFAAVQAAQGMSGPLESFIPSGLVSPSGEPVNPPESHALISGYVLEVSQQVNTFSGLPFWWTLVKTVGGTFDVVIDPELLSEAPRPGAVISGWFWLSGRLSTGESRPKAASGWFQRLVGR